MEGLRGKEWVRGEGRGGEGTREGPPNCGFMPL
jgi:hypothetical protein